MHYVIEIEGSITLEVLNHVYFENHNFYTKTQRLRPYVAMTHRENSELQNSRLQYEQGLTRSISKNFQPKQSLFMNNIDLENLIEICWNSEKCHLNLINSQNPTCIKNCHQSHPYICKHSFPQSCNTKDSQGNK